MPAHPFVAKASQHRLQFRSLPDHLVEFFQLDAHEGCLLHVDNPLTASLGVYVNPRVRVTRTRTGYRAAHRRGADEPDWLSAWWIVRGTWAGRIRRLLHGAPENVPEARVARWREGNPGAEEPGLYCLGG